MSGVDTMDAQTWSTSLRFGVAVLITAAVVEERGAPFALQTLELEDPRQGEVLVRVVAAGICQTDLHIRDGEFPAAFPVVCGHEGAGIVERVGRGVSDVSPGDRVVMSYPFCGECRNCRRTRYPYCIRGADLCFGGRRMDGSTALRRDDGTPVAGHIFQQSSFATHALATQTNVIRVGDGVRLELLGPLGCGLQTGAGAVINSFAAGPGDSVAVLGVGTVGLAAVMAGKLVGADPIVAVDVVEERLALAAELGATHTIRADTDDVAERIVAVTGRGADCVLEATGRPEMLSVAVNALAMTGTAALVAGVAPGTRAELDMTTLLNGRTVRGVIQGDAIEQLFIPELIALHEAGRFPFERLVRFYDFDDINQAVDDMQAGGTVKPVLRIGEDS